MTTSPPPLPQTTASAAAPLLEIAQLTMRFGGIVALENVSFTVSNGRIAGLIGPNGAGKTTLFNCLSRLYRSERGDIRLNGRSLRRCAASDIAAIGIGRTFQSPARKRVELARALAVGPSLLLLDEPAGGLNHDEVAELGALIRSVRDQLAITILLVEHHMGLVMSLSDQVVVLNFGRVIADGSLEEVRGNPAVAEAYLGTRY